jgi:flagellar biosynthesis protein FliP
MTFRMAGAVVAAAMFCGTVVAAESATEVLGGAVRVVGGDSAGLNDALRMVLVLTVLALLPAIVVAMTSFTRTVIVLSMLRHAFGMQDTPPNIVLVSLALFLTLFTMSPELETAYKNGLQPLSHNEISMDVALTRSIQPLREFMLRQTRESDLQLILEAAHVAIPDSVEQVRTIHIIPAFLLSELKTAFQIGFVIFLPFLLLDLVVSSVLMSMGMLMVPPTIISLPLKVLMFVIIDGWGLTVRAILGSFH